MQASTIQALPAELIEQIALYLGPNDFLSMRKACTFFNAPLQFAFIKKLESKAITQVAAGEGHCIFLRKDGTVAGCGGPLHSLLGLDPAEAPVREPMVIPNLFDVAQIFAGGFHTFFLKRDGTVWAGGNNSWGPLGVGNLSYQPVPVRIPNLDHVRSIATSLYHTLFLKEDGTVWGCGYDTMGRLGLGGINNYLTPTLIPQLDKVKQVACSEDHSVFLREDGSVLACGKNDRGQLGLGDQISRLTPTPLANLTNVSGIGAGKTYTVFLKADGTVYSSGRIAYTALETETHPIPVDMMMDNVSRIVSGAYHVICLKQDGSVWSFGFNDQGQLGVGDVMLRLGPVKIPGLSHISQAAVGEHHTVLLKEDGTVMVCGYNGCGTIGLGEKSSPTVTPTPIAILNRWSDMLERIEEASTKETPNMQFKLS